MSNIKPIETEYKGYRFRSRLEARWAVLFDEAKIPWQYEVEGYELSNGVKYLPDFYLPTFQLYIEIKPLVQNSEPDWKEQVEKWETKCGQFRTDSGKAIMILYGDPMTEIWGRLFAWTTDDLVCSEKGIIEEYNGNSRFVPSGDPDTPEVFLLTSNNEKKQICITSTGKTNKKVINPFMLVLNDWDYAFYLLAAPMYREQVYVDLEGSFDNACKKARQARFEHGESGYKKKEHHVHGLSTTPDWLMESTWWPTDDWEKFFEFMHKQGKGTGYAQQTQKLIHTYRLKTAHKELLNLATLDMYKEHGYTPTGEWIKKQWCDDLIEAGIITKKDGVYEFDDLKFVEYFDQSRLQGDNVVIQCT